MRGLGTGDRIAQVAVCVVALFALAVLVVPAFIVLAISFDTRPYVSFPPAGVTLGWYEALLRQRDVVSAFVTSLEVAGLVTALCLALGVPAALGVARGRFPGRRGLGLLLAAPQAVPGIVLGVAVLFAGATFSIRASTGMLIVALSCYFIALTTRLTAAQLASLNPALEQASLNLGAGRLRTFLRITLPQLAPALFTAAAFTFIEAFDNVSVAMFTHDYRRPPLPVQLLALVETDNSPLVAAISGVEIVLAATVLLLGAGAFGLERFSGLKR